MESRDSSKGGGGGTSSRFISQIFWPEHCLDLGNRRGYMIGWNTAAFKCLVVTLVTVEEDTGYPTLKQTERALEVLAADPRSRTLNSFCSSGGTPPTVLGEWLPAGPREYRPSSGSGATSRLDEQQASAASRRQTANIWLTVGQQDGRPVLRSLYCCGCAYTTCCYVVFYRPCNPDALEFIPTLKHSTNSSLSEDKSDLDGDDYHGPGDSRGSPGLGSQGSSLGTKQGTSVGDVGSDTVREAARRRSGVDRRARGSGGVGAIARRSRTGGVGHGTALVSPSARQNTIGNGADGLFGRNGGGGGGGGGGEDPTDLDYSMRQVGCALALERALGNILRDILHKDKMAGTTRCRTNCNGTDSDDSSESGSNISAGDHGVKMSGADGHTIPPTQRATAAESIAESSPVLEQELSPDTPVGVAPLSNMSSEISEFELESGQRVTLSPARVVGDETSSPSSLISSVSPSPGSLQPAPSGAPTALSPARANSDNSTNVNIGGNKKNGKRSRANADSNTTIWRSSGCANRVDAGKTLAGIGAVRHVAPGIRDSGAVRQDPGGVHMPTSMLGRLFLDSLCVLLGAFRVVAGGLVAALEAKVIWTPLGDEVWRSACDTSLACAHIASRVRMALVLPLRLKKAWRERHQPAEKRAGEVVSLSEGLFGLATDASLGAIACVLLLRHTVGAARAVHHALHLLHVDVLREELEWLNYFPAGFKLNVPLTLTLGSGTLVGMEVYASIVGQLAQYEGVVMKGIAFCAAAGGLTLALAVSHDILRLLALHTATAHTAFATLQNIHSSLLGSLWQLFRGRKHNILRQRVDTCTYDACQLLLGTLVFTVLFFLSPTMAVYYTFFCIVQAVAVGAQASMVCLFVLVNELPAYRFLLALTSPDRMLSGVQLQILDAPLTTSSRVSRNPPLNHRQRSRGSEGHEDEDGYGRSTRPTQRSWATAGMNGANMVYFRLRRCHAPVSTLLRPYTERARRAARRYPAAALAKSLVLGKPLPDIGFQDFVTAGPGFFSCRNESDRENGDRIDDAGREGEGENQPAGTGARNRGEADWGPGGGWSGGTGEKDRGAFGLPSARELVRESRSLWLEYCYGC